MNSTDSSGATGVHTSPNCFFDMLLVLCDKNELNSDYSGKEHDQVHGLEANVQAQFSNNHFNNEVTQSITPSNNGEEYSEVEKQGDEFIDKNVTYLPIKQNKTDGNNETDADYDYDYVESHNIFNWSELIPTLVVYGATMVIGIAGNSLIIFTICRYRRMKSTTNVFLASLASADLLLITICIPVKRFGSWILLSSSAKNERHETSVGPLGRPRLRVNQQIFLSVPPFYLMAEEKTSFENIQTTDEIEKTRIIDATNQEDSHLHNRSRENLKSHRIARNG
ncbi:KiSS-1 receptor [Zootermopsis nevadensis]|uniref:KiSS-1 receptor n=1 Tax=Zootermopsis nevadensis TaxID=136037 RepID=A0A067QNB1_ZOONE|nr:KiSS-1 receptor [Zootermopsis nevadensis]